MAEDVMLQAAIEAVRQGRRVRARDLLTRLLRADSANPEYWIWMSAVVDTQREQVYCLQSALKLDPDSASVRQGLITLGALIGADEVTPAPILRRRWQVEQQALVERHGLQALWANPLARIGGLIATSLAVVALLGLGLFMRSPGRQMAARFPTHTPGPTPTYTYTPTAINETRRPTIGTPIPSGPPPLWMLLEATYTPTPIHFSTPHPINESFRIAQMAAARGDTASALEHYQQAARSEPDSPDILFAIGETFFSQGDFNSALEYYESAIAVDPDFAPAHLGRANVRQALNPKVDLRADLQAAIEKDPNYGEAYLAMVELLIGKEDLEAASENLDEAAALLPDSPLAALYRARILIAQNQPDAALEAARRANHLDRTLLATYLALGEAAAAAGEPDEALEAVETYLTYATDDPAGYLVKAQALYAGDAFTNALSAANQAIALDRTLLAAYRWRGLALLELGQGQKAVNDLGIFLQAEPQSFQNNLDFSRALLAANRLGDALGQINRAETLAEDDLQMAGVFYWRAQILEKIGNLPGATKDWKALAALPPDSIPPVWLELAESRLKATATPPPPSATPTRTPTATTTSSRTPTLTPTWTPTRTPAPSATPRPSRTPTRTRTPLPSRTRTNTPTDVPARTTPNR